MSKPINLKYAFVFLTFFLTFQYSQESKAGPFTAGGYGFANLVLWNADWKSSCAYLRGDSSECKDFGGFEILRGIPYVGGLMDAATHESPRKKLVRTISRNSWLLVLQALSVVTAAEKAAEAAEAAKELAKAEGIALVVAEKAEQSFAKKCLMACAEKIEMGGDWIQKVIIPQVDKALTLVVGIDRSSEAINLLKAFIYGEIFNVSNLRDFSEGTIEKIVPESLTEEQCALLNTALKVFTGITWTIVQLNSPSP